MQQYLHAKLNVYTRNATENTVVMMQNKGVNSLLHKWAEEKLEMINR